MLGLTRLDHQRNEVIREKLKVKSIVSEIDEYSKNWKSHVERMENFRFPKAALHYKPRGQRDSGRPTKRWADQGTSEQAMMSKTKKSEEEEEQVGHIWSTCFQNGHKKAEMYCTT
jgi:hypothetical protein